MKTFFLLLGLCLVSAIAAADKRPNIVLIMTDDMGYSDLGCFGGEIKTPNLDSLAANGLRYRNFYSENMCWVSRAAMLSGIYHKTSLHKSTFHPNVITLMELLKQQGYQTRMAGKWHLGNKNSSPMHRGFEQWYGILGGASSFFHPEGLLRNNKDAAAEYNNKDYYFTDAVSDSCVNYIKKAQKDKPLFLYVAYTAAHWPLHARDTDIAKYKGKYSMGWDQLRAARLKRMKELGIINKELQLSERNSQVPAWESETNKTWQERRMEVYAAQVTVMDEGVGRIVNALKETARFENTLILYTIDNGGCHVEYSKSRKGSYLPEKTRDGGEMKPGNIPALMPGPENTYQSYGYGWANASNTPYRMFKQYSHEGGIRTPMIAHWPKNIKAKGEWRDQVAHLIDIMPTILDINKLEHPSVKEADKYLKMDGISLLDSMISKDKIQARTLFFSHAKGMALRVENWKLVTRTDKKSTKKWELYDLDKDPTESKNLAVKFPEKVTAMSKQWETWHKKLLNKQKKFK